MYRYRLLLCSLFALAIVMLSSCAGATQPAGSATPTAASATATPGASPTPASTPAIVTATPATSGVQAIADNYYKAVAARDYSKAYAYMDPGVTSPLHSNQPITQDQYTLIAQGVDQTAGPVVNYASIVSSSDPTLVVMTLTRKQGLRYHSHLKMKQVSGAWKIISFDTV